MENAVKETESTDFTCAVKGTVSTGFSFAVKGTVSTGFSCAVKGTDSKGFSCAVKGTASRGFHITPCKIWRERNRRFALKSPSDDTPMVIHKEQECTVKKVNDFPIPSWDVTNQTLSN
jgi:hypothetical protein